MAQSFLSVYSEFKSYGIENQIDYSKSCLYSLVTHSTAIEGSTVTEVAKAAKKSRATVGRCIQQLTGKHIRRIGSDRNGHWEIISDIQVR